MNLIKPGTNIDFVGKRKIAGIVSFTMVVASLLLFFIKGPNWGIDFTGGTEITIDFADGHPVEIAGVRKVLEGLGVSGDAVQGIGDPEEQMFVIRIQDPTFGTEGLKDGIEQALVARFGPDWIQESFFDVQVGARLSLRYGGDPVPLTTIQQAVAGIDGASVVESPDDNTVYIRVPGIGQSVGETVLKAFAADGETVEQVGQVVSAETIGPRVGGDLRRQGFIAVMATLGLVLLYVAFRFEIAFAPGAVLALFHDVVIVIGIFTLTRQEFNLSMIGALLTIIGYSLNDTIVIYDRIRENMSRYRRRDTTQLINTSINETLNRTVATSLTTGVAMVAFLFLGGPVIETFAMAILLGVFFGTYSTVYVASPMIVLTEDLKPYLARVFAPLASGGEPAKVEGDTAGTSEDGALSASQRRRLERKERRVSPSEPTT